MRTGSPGTRTAHNSCCRAMKTTRIRCCFHFQIFRTTSIPCQNQHTRIPEESHGLLRGECAEFEFASNLRRRTHLFYVEHPVPENDPHEITLMTVFTLDRSYQVPEKKTIQVLFPQNSSCQRLTQRQCFVSSHCLLRCFHVAVSG